MTGTENGYLRDHRLMLVDPETQDPLRLSDGALVSPRGVRFPVVKQIPRFVPGETYADSFGFQWNRFRRTQIDQESQQISRGRFFAETAWAPEDLDDARILEVGSGAGRFTDVLMRHTRAQVASLDYSQAVEANFANNEEFVKSGRLLVVQASVYEMPFPDGYFERAFCFGVLQHTPDFRKSLEAIYAKVKPAGDMAVDFYPINGWWTKVSAKYMLRPITKRMSEERLLALVRAGAPALIAAYRGLKAVRLGALTRFLPVCDIDGTLPRGLDPDQLREWIVLDTFDMFSPAYDNPQRIETVARWMKELGADVTFAGFAQYGSLQAAVVRCRKPGRPPAGRNAEGAGA